MNASSNTSDSIRLKSMTKDNAIKQFGKFFRNEYESFKDFVSKYIDESYHQVSVDDLIQDVALHFFNKLSFDQPVADISAYFYRSLKNKITDTYRKRKKSSSLDALMEVYGELDMPPLYEDDMLPEEILDESFYPKLLAALDCLNDNQRAVFIATELEGRTFKSLSEELGIPVGTLLARKSRALSRLREAYSPDMFKSDKI